MRLPISYCCAIAMVLALVSETPGKGVVIYPAPAGASASPVFQVTADGQDVFVYDTEVGAYACFAMSGATEVEITAKGGVRGCDVRPLRRNIHAVAKDNTVALRLAEPCNLSIEINGDKAKPLFLFANPVEQQQFQLGAESVRYFAPGKIHDVGELVVGSDETVFIPGGAVVRGTIRASNAHNVRIKGHGILDGSTVKPQHAFISLRECRDVRIDGIMVVDSFGWTVHLQDCDDVTVNNVKLIGWRLNSDGIDIDGSRNVRVTGSFLRTGDDCVAIKAFKRSVENVEVADTVFWPTRASNAMEIGFELRAGLVHGVLFRDCDILHLEHGAAFGIHNGGSATVRDIAYEDVTIEDSGPSLVDFYIGLSIYSDDCPPQWHRNSWSRPDRERIPPERIARPPTFGTAQWVKPLDEERPGYAKNRGHIHGIRFRNIRVAGKAFPASIIGGFDPEHTVDDVVFEGLWINGEPISSLTEGRFVVENAGRISFVGEDR